MARWPPLDGDSVGLARGLGSNEKVEMTLSASGQTGRGLHVAHLHFLPWLYLTRGDLEPFVGRPSYPGRSLLMLNEATATS